MDKKKKSFQTVRIIVSAIFAIWIILGTVDYPRVKNFKRPIFSIPLSTADDGGSGTYQGLGYSFEIKGNFMPEDEFPEVTYYKYYLFGNFIQDRLRD